MSLARQGDIAKVAAALAWFNHYGQAAAQRLPKPVDLCSATLTIGFAFHAPARMAAGPTRQLALRQIA